MKKYLTFSLLLLLFGLSYAQLPGSASNYYNDYGETFGLKIGWNFSNIHGEDINKTKTKTGFIGTLFSEIPRNDYFSIQPEIIFSMKGWKEKYSEGYYDEDISYWGRLNYLELAVLGKLKLKRDNHIIPSLYFGPCFGFNVGSTYKVSYNGDTETGDIEDINNFEFSILPGIMIDIKSRFIVDVIDIRYSIGITDILAGINEIEPIKNSVISIMLGKRF